MTCRASQVAASFLLVVTVVLAGCSLEGGARETFSKEFSCPVGSVTAKERKDIDALGATAGSTPEPPSEIKEDPARYEVWKKNQSDQREAFNSRMTVFSAKGCNHEALYLCAHPNSGNDGAMNYADVSCSKLPSR